MLEFEHRGVQVARNSAPSQHWAFFVGWLACDSIFYHPCDILFSEIGSDGCCSSLVNCLRDCTQCFRCIPQAVCLHCPVASQQLVVVRRAPRLLCVHVSMPLDLRRLPLPFGFVCLAGLKSDEVSCEIDRAKLKSFAVSCVYDIIAVQADYHSKVSHFVGSIEVDACIIVSSSAHFTCYLCCPAS
jgi:hypothetical protein